MQQARGSRYDCRNAPPLKDSPDLAIAVNIYIDDTVLAGTRRAVYSFKCRIIERFTMKDLGPLVTILGVDVVRGMASNKITGIIQSA